MKRFLIIAILIFAMFFPPVSASGVYTEHATIGDNWVLGLDYNMSQSPTEICDLYGWTVYPGYTEKLYHVYFKDPAAVALAYGLVPADNFTSVATELHYPGNTSIVAINTNTYPSTALYAECNNAGSRESVGIIHALYNSSVYLPPPIANFTAFPLNATAPAYIPFTDTSENEYDGCTYNWSFTPTTGVLVAPQDLDNEDITMLFTENGDFTISHGVECPGGSSIKTRTDYIHIFNATALSTFRVRAVDAISGYGVNGAQVDVFDIENSSWTNQTSVTGEVTVTALTGHTINAYGSATGYDDGESLGLQVVANSLYPIYMWSTNMSTNVSAGNLTLYVTVLEDGTNTRLSGYDLTVFAPYGVYFSGQTNTNGVFQTTIANKTDYNIEVGPQKGHLGAQKIFNSGTQVGGGDAFVEQTIWIPLSSVTTGPTVTTLPGGGTPTPTVTVLPGCEDLTTQEGRDKCNTAQGGQMMGMLYEYGAAIVGLCILTIIIGLMKMW